MEQPTEKPASDRLADDLLIGCAAIAEFLGLPAKKVYYLAHEKRLPIGRLGKQLIASKTKLRRAIRDLT